METKSMTVKEVLNDVMASLNNIKIPMSEIDSIGLPIRRAVDGIKVCVDAMDRAEAEEKKAAQAENGDEPKIELVPLSEDEIPENAQ